MRQKSYNKAVSVLTLGMFIISGIAPSWAQTRLVMPAPGTVVPLSAPARPAAIVGLQLDRKDPFRFRFLVDRGEREMGEAGRQEEYHKLVKYFLASLTIPNKDMWVNLSPFEQGRIIPDNFAQTEMGRDLLAEDYMLKQITASLIYPDSEVGRAFWQKVYQKTSERYGSADVPVDTFNKVWIVPDKAVIYEKGDTAVIVGQHLKVMLETDYVATRRAARDGGDIGDVLSEGDVQADTGTRELSREIIREIVLSLLEREVNEGEHFAVLRQVYSAMILATWFKRARQSSLLGQVYTDKNRIAGIELGDPQARDRIYAKYVEAYKKGAFDLIRDEHDPQSDEIIPRRYFSGGVKGLDPQTAEIVHDVNRLDRDQKAMLAFVQKKADMVQVRLKQAVRSIIRPSESLDRALQRVRALLVMVRYRKTVKKSPATMMTTDEGRLDHSRGFITGLMKKIADEKGRTAVALDVGVGAPPHTTRELAGDVEGFGRVIGMDLNIPAYVIDFYQGSRMRAYFDRGAREGEENLVFFGGQENLLPQDMSPQEFQSVTDIGRRLIRQARDKNLAEYEENFEDHRMVRVVRDPFRQGEYKRDNLQFVEADLFNLSPAVLGRSGQKADVVRISNLFFRHLGMDQIPEALENLLPVVSEGGLVMIGFSHVAMTGHGEEYLVYRKKGNSFEFDGGSFSVNNYFDFGAGGLPRGDESIRLKSIPHLSVSLGILWSTSLLMSGDPRFSPEDWALDEKLQGLPWEKRFDLGLKRLGHLTAADPQQDALKGILEDRAIDWSKYAYTPQEVARVGYEEAFRLEQARKEKVYRERREQIDRARAALARQLAGKLRQEGARIEQYGDMILVGQDSTRTPFIEPVLKAFEESYLYEDDGKFAGAPRYVGAGKRPLRKKGDPAQAVSPSDGQPYGGIDLNERYLGLDIRRDAEGVPLSLKEQPAALSEISGFSPVIVDIVPLDPSQLPIFANS